MSDWIGIGAIWINEDKKIGMAFNDDHITKQLKLSQLGSTVKVFFNDYKKEEKHPDYKLFIHRDELVKLGISANQPEQSSGMTTEMPKPEEPAEDSDVPF